ncbi:TetR/AcrR family transcriptional regulator [Thiohalomonas denitrificans]|uniref:Transcriptional regulator, TetR family n=1 Tax=Thiohalomonas denitrificans TaxID=415747 RepID=A0A1G5QNM3_9GAMM|nr:TetR/AcrR family transcriptional regulator [Thiohalomonas denitrificans]SCZ63256.1 transcriptional regulator, TetR family [Thiohalomonas denitrificans]
MGRNSDTRDRLVEAAIDLIYARSFGAVGVQEICARARVQKGSFYHFFRSKQELAMAAIDVLWQRLQVEVFDPAFADDVPPLERIARFFTLSARFQRNQAKVSGHVLGCPFGNLALEMSTQDEVIRGRVDAVFRLAERRIEQALEAALADGSAPHIDPPSAARAVFAFMEGALLMAKTRNDAKAVSTLGRSALALLTAGGKQSARAG